MSLFDNPSKLLYFKVSVMSGKSIALGCTAFVDEISQ